MHKKKKPPQHPSSSTGKPRKCAVPWLLVIMLVPNLLAMAYLSVILNQVRRISSDLVQELKDTTSTNSLSTAVQINNAVAIQIRQNVQHIVWTTFIINRMNEKIRSGMVDLNKSYVPSLINEEELYKNLAEPTLLRMFKDTPLRTSVWLQQNTTSVSGLSPTGTLNLQSTSSLAALTRAVQLQSLNSSGQFSKSRPSLGIQQIFIGYEIDGMLASTGFIFTSQMVDQYKQSTGQSIFDFDSTSQPWYRFSLQQNEAVSMSPITDVNNLFESDQGLICQHSQGSLDLENDYVICNLFQTLNFQIFSENLGSSTSNFFLIEPTTMKLFYYYKQNNKTESNSSSSIFSLETTVLSKYSSETANKIKAKLKEVIQASKAKQVPSINLLTLDTSSNIDQLQFSENGQTFVILFQTVYSISKNLNSTGYTISSAYIFANVISYAEVNQLADKQLTNIGVSINLTGVSVIIVVILFSLIQILYSFVISRQFNKPIKHLTDFLKNLQEILEINKTNRCESSNMDTMQQFKQQDLASSGRLSNHNNNQLAPDEILPLLDEKVFFLSWDTQQLYLCFKGLFKILTAANQKVLRLSPEAQTKALINLADQLSYFGSFQNHSALGVCHNNIACIHFNRGRFLEALQHFSASIVQVKYELDEYQDNKMSTALPGGGSSRQQSIQSKRDHAQSILIQGNNNNNTENLPNIFNNQRKHFAPGTQELLEIESNHFQTLCLKLFNRKYDYIITLYLLIHLETMPNEDPLYSRTQQPFDASALHHVNDLISELLTLEKYLEFSNGARLLQLLLLKASLKLDLNQLDEANAVIEQCKQLLEEISPKLDPLSEIKSLCFPLTMIPSATTIPILDDNFTQQQPQQQYPKERKSIFRKEQNLLPLGPANNRNIKSFEKQYLSIKDSGSQVFSPMQIDNSNRSNQKNKVLPKSVSINNNNNIIESEKVSIGFSNQALVIDSDKQMPSNHQYFNFSKACTQEMFRANIKDERKPTHRESENLLMKRQSSHALITRLPSRQEFYGSPSKKIIHKKQQLFSIVPTKFDTKGNELACYHDRNSSKSLNPYKVRRFLSDEIVARYEFFPDVLSTQLSLIKAEYAMKNSKFYEAAEILTKDLESSQFYMSHVRYIHIQKIAQVFSSQDIPCDYLKDFQESFNENIFFKIAVVSICSRLANRKRTYVFCKDLIREVLNREQDKFGLISCRKNLHVSLEIPVISSMSISKQSMLIKNQMKRVYLEYDAASEKVKDDNYYQIAKSGYVSFFKNQSKLPQKDATTIQEISVRNQFSLNEKTNINNSINLIHQTSVQDQGNLSMTRNQILSVSQDRSRGASFLNDSSFYEDDEIEKIHPSNLNSQELTLFSLNGKGKAMGQESPYPPVEQFDFEKTYLQFFKKNSNPKLTEQDGFTDNLQHQQQHQAQDYFETFIENSQTKLSENTMTIQPSSLVSFSKPVFLPVLESSKFEKQENFQKQATNEIKRRICTSEPSPSHQEKVPRIQSSYECFNHQIQTEKLSQSKQKESYTRAFHLSVRKAIVDILFEEKSFEMNKILQKARKTKEACGQTKEYRQFDQIKYERFIVVSTDENNLIQDYRFESLTRCLYYHSILLLVLHLGAEEQFKERRFQNGTNYNQKLVIQFFYSEENLLLFLNNKRDKPFVNTLPLMYEYFQTRFFLGCIVVIMQSY